MIDESVLDELFIKIKFVSAHHSFFVLDNRSCLQLKAKRHLSQAYLVLQPSSNVVFLLVEDCKLIISAGQYGRDANLILA